ncbi:hypothetical protein A4G23_02034 [Streptomyces rubrolavendulae]|uniref:Uncharacterized protein n=2 Tax=Streptomyces TaxID=1883 RepID=A0A1D8G186_9ACTN|nr:hypothetical protein A4G23_02034 [Streptomyces rubrolavendulae]OSY52664.1 hypothetical protein BG846_01682 [Streptomyces fradiae ATCC 10745 = DSM 40063]
MGGPSRPSRVRAPRSVRRSTSATVTIVARLPGGLDRVLRRAAAPTGLVSDGPAAKAEGPAALGPVVRAACGRQSSRTARSCSAFGTATLARSSVRVWMVNMAMPSSGRASMRAAWTGPPERVSTVRA